MKRIDKMNEKELLELLREKYRVESIKFYRKGWEISSYKHGTPFAVSEENYQWFKYPTGKTLKDAVNEAYKFMMADQVI